MAQGAFACAAVLSMAAMRETEPDSDYACSHRLTSLPCTFFKDAVSDLDLHTDVVEISGNSDLFLHGPAQPAE